MLQRAGLRNRCLAARYVTYLFLGEGVAIVSIRFRMHTQLIGNTGGPPLSMQLDRGQLLWGLAGPRSRSCKREAGRWLVVSSPAGGSRADQEQHCTHPPSQVRNACVHLFVNQSGKIMTQENACGLDTGLHLNGSKLS